MGNRRLHLCLSFGVIALLTLSAFSCFAGEVAVLKNGFAIRHERHEVVGDITRLYVSSDGSSFVDVPTTQVDHFEVAADLPPSSAGSSASSSQVPTAGFNPAALTRNGSNGIGAARAAGLSTAPKPNISEVVNDASARYQLDPDLVNSVIKAESGFNARAVSPKGARGLMQLMPGTASQLAVPNAFDPRANVEGGTKYLRELLERYNFDMVKALAAYNAGPQRVERFGGVPPYYETRAYVARIVRDFNKKKAAQQKAAAARKSSTGKDAGARTSMASAKANSSNAVRTRASASNQ